MHILFFLVFHHLLKNTLQNLDFEYHDDQRLQLFLQQINYAYPRNTFLYNVGHSVEGRNLTVLAVSNIDLRDEHKFDNFRNVKLIANIHGDEAVGRELLLHFIDYIFHPPYVWDRNYQTLQHVLNDTIIHILPSMNPDGFERSYVLPLHNWRGNAKRIDLNRNFHDYIEGVTPTVAQPETLAIVRWLEEINFVFSVSFHGGAVVVSYPFDNKFPNSPVDENETPDSDVFQFLSLSYADHVKNPLIQGHCHDRVEPIGYVENNEVITEFFENGITNGAKWYPLRGGMQDYNYFHGVFELTIELSCPKFPPPRYLYAYWRAHRDALINLMNDARKGINGRIINSHYQPIYNASVYIDERMPVFTNKQGYFWRILLPGAYQIKIVVSGYSFYGSAIVPHQGILNAIYTIEFN